MGGSDDSPRCCGTCGPVDCRVVQAANVKGHSGYETRSLGKQFTVAIVRRGVWKPWTFTLDIGPGRWQLNGRAWTEKEARQAVDEFMRPFLLMGFTETERR